MEIVRLKKGKSFSGMATFLKLNVSLGGRLK
jgi:hypothetical protein